MLCQNPQCDLQAQDLLWYKDSSQGTLLIRTETAPAQEKIPEYSYSR